VEGSTPSETKKGAGNRGGASNVEAPASPARIRVRMKARKGKGRKTLDHINLEVNRSGRAGLKEGANVAVGKWTTRKTEHLQEDVASTALRRKGTVVCR
jgi:hypothetical protein